MDPFTPSFPPPPLGGPHFAPPCPASFQSFTYPWRFWVTTPLGGRRGRWWRDVGGETPRRARLQLGSAVQAGQPAQDSISTSFFILRTELRTILVLGDLLDNLDERSERKVWIQKVMTIDERLTGFAFLFTEPFSKDAGSWKFCLVEASVIGLRSLEGKENC